VYRVGIDIGGTAIKGGLFSGSSEPLAWEEVPTTATEPDQLVSSAIELISRLRARHHVHSVGVAVAAFLSADRSRVELSPNISWENRPLRQELVEATGLSVVIENDANAAAYAEFHEGAGTDVSSMVMLTLGTGVGGAVIESGRLLVGARGIAAELGHVIVEPEGAVCGCGQRGCVETVSSGTAMMAMVSAETGQQVTTSAELQRLLESDDALVDLVVGRVARGVIHALINIQAVLDPPVAIIGGGVGERLGGVLQSHLDSARTELLAGRRSTAFPEIRFAQLGNRAGALGAALLASTPAADAAGR